MSIFKTSKVNFPATPTYYTDPNFSGTQSFLKNYSEDILKGNIPDYYKGIGQTMDPALMKDYVYGIGSDVQGRELAQQALSGRARTGMSNNTIAQVGQLSAGARMQDYMNSLEGKKWLMNTGMSGEQSVGNAAFNNMGAQNNFSQWKYGADLNAEQSRANAANASRANMLSLIKYGGGGDLIDTVASVFGGQGSMGTNKNVYSQYNPGTSAYSSGNVYANTDQSNSNVLSNLSGLGSGSMYSQPTPRGYNGSVTIPGQNPSIAQGADTKTKSSSGSSGILSSLLKLIF